MAANGDANPIAAPLATPPRLGLLASAVRPPIDDRVHWPLGIIFRPEASRGALPLEGGAWWDCVEGAGTDPDDPDQNKTAGPANPDAVRYRPWQVVEGENCSSTGFAAADYIGRARRRLLANEAWKVEREFWLGEVAQQAGFPNDYLTNPATVVDLGQIPLIYALAELQTYLADTIPGRGMIHCTVRTSTLWLSTLAIRREGNLLLDVMDNIIVPGTGYSGDEPLGSIPTVLGETEWAFATGMVQLLEDEVTITPDEFGVALDKTRNRVTYEAERYVAAFHDGQAHAGVAVDLCNTCCSSAS